MNVHHNYIQYTSIIIYNIVVTSDYLLEIVHTLLTNF